MTTTMGSWNPVKIIQTDRVFFGKLITLALPIALQNLIATGLNMLDTLMIGQLGEIPISAVALSNQIFFLQILLLFGISSGSGAFAAQFWGKNDLQGIHKTQGLALVLSITGSLIFTVLALLLPREILGLFTTDQQVIEQGIPYLRITSISYSFTAITMVYQSVLRSTGFVKLPLAVSVMALSLNGIFNYALIFGKFGMPLMGAKGAAIATTSARALEMIVLVAIVYGKKYPAASSLKEMLSFHKPFAKRFIHKVSPVILNEIGWSFGMTMFTLVFARMGTDVLASYNITDTVTRLCFVFFQGTGLATAVVLGNMIGEGDHDHAQRCAKKILYLSPLLALVFASALFISSPYIPLMFNILPSSQLLVSQFLKVVSFILFVKVSNMHIVVGILRSGGDTHFCAIMELVPLWLFAIPVVAIGGLVLGFAPPLVYALAMSEEVWKYILGLKRVISQKWIHDLS